MAPPLLRLPRVQHGVNQLQALPSVQLRRLDAHGTAHGQNELRRRLHITSVLVPQRRQAQRGSAGARGGERRRVVGHLAGWHA
jgi:hypothetical protein